jgi:DNA anti-recombination protein RmuC
MKTKAMWVGLLLSMCLLGGCGRDHEDVAEDTVETLEEMAEVLATVKDKESALAAKPKLEKLSERMDELQAEAAEMDEIDPEKEKALQEKYDERMTKAMGKLMGEMFRIGMNQELNNALGDTVKLQPSTP